ncbi:MAG TPA: hypothetical protein VFU73_07430 [Actinocrinis sp.]|nr:hypothetical protein [Actinocrinis sp.]
MTRNSESSEHAQSTVDPVAPVNDSPDTDGPAGSASQAGTADPEARRLSRRRRLQGMAVLAVVGVGTGITGSWMYNSGYRARAADNQAIIVTGADLPQFVDHAASSHKITMPIANDSPYAVTVYEVKIDNAPDFTWDGDNAVIQPGQTNYLTVTTPASCPVALPAGRMPSDIAATEVRLHTISGGPHKINLGFSGVLGYAVKQCGQDPSASATP